MQTTDVFEDAVIIEQPAELVAIAKKEKLPEDLAFFTIQKFEPIWQQINEWKQKADALIVNDISQVDKMEQAKRARLAVKKVRTSANNLREDLKAESLRYGRAVQGLYNEIEKKLKPIEDHLETQERFAERQRELEKINLRLARTEECVPYKQWIISTVDLGDITDDDYYFLLSGAMLQKRAAEEQAEKAALERQANEKRDAENRERLQKENERLKLRTKELHPYIVFIRDYNGMLTMEESEYQKQLAEIKICAEQTWQFEREEQIKKQAETECSQKENHRLKALNAEADKKLAEVTTIPPMRPTAMPTNDKEKMQGILDEMRETINTRTFKSEHYRTLHKNVGELVGKIINYATSKMQ